MSDQEMFVEIFSTCDVYLASTLISLKFRMVGIDYQFTGDRNRPIGFFKFEESDALKEARTKYTQGLISIEPKLFVTNLKSLKSEVMGAFNNPHLTH